MMEVNKEMAGVFLKHLVSSYDNIGEQKEAKERLNQHLDSMKKNLKPKKTKGFDFDSEWKELENRMEVALEKQSKVIKNSPDEKVGLIKSIEDLDKRLSKYLEYHENRNSRIKEIEDRVTGKALEKIKNKKEIKDQMKIMETSLKALETDQSVDKERHKALKDKIKELKKRL